MPDVYVAGKRVRLDPSKAIGKGGEADVYDAGNGVAVKLFKPPTHPDFTGFPVEQKHAVERLRQHQTKLPAFPKNLPAGVVVPLELATDKNGQIVGYTMEYLARLEALLRYSDRSFRDNGGIASQSVVNLFVDLHGLVGGIHNQAVVIGDFNDLNVLVTSHFKACIIDADSFQFGSFLCSMFTAKFVDPILCDPHASSLVLRRPHNENSDWYAYAVMLMQCLLYVDPYGGVYRPKNPADRMPHTERPLHRVTVFNDEVKYPKPAIHYSVLPDDLSDHFMATFIKDERKPFPVSLVESLRWTTCMNCNKMHLRSRCPWCQAGPAVSPVSITKIRGTVTSTRIFHTRGTVVHATVQGGKLLYLYHDVGSYRREDGSEVAVGELNPQIRYRIQGGTTLLGRVDRFVRLSPGRKSEVQTVDTFGSLPVFDANAKHSYWVSEGQLLRNDARFGGSQYIGDVLRRQTLFWVGPEFGFGFYRAGEISMAFVFGAEGPGLNDNVKLGPIKGQLLDALALFSSSLCWFFYAVQDGPRAVNHCVTLNAAGQVIGRHEAEVGADDWLGNLRGKFPTSNYLFAATDDGIVRVESDSGVLQVTKTFPDTEPFLNSNSRLLAGSDGIYVVHKQDIHRLQMR